MAIVTMGIAANAGTVIGDFEYNISSGTAYVKPTQAFRNSNPTSVSIPGFVTINGQKYPVGIDTQAFYGMTTVESVWMNYGVRAIALNAFGHMDKLSSVHIPSSVTWMGVGIFTNCGGSASGSTLTINWATLNPGSVSIYDDTFGGVSATYKKVNMPTKAAVTKAKNISYLTNYFSVNNTPAPNSCYDMSNGGQFYVVTSDPASSSTGEMALTGIYSSYLVVNLSATTGCTAYGKTYYATSVAEQAFDGNSFINTVVISGPNVTIEKNAFSYCTNLYQAGLTCGQIREEAFYGCTSLATITVGEGVNYIASRAFAYCPMSTLNIPASLETFAVTAVTKCLNLEKFTVASGNTKYATYSTYGALYSKDLKTLYKVPAYNSYTAEGAFPTQLTTIFDYAFSDNRRAGYIAIPYGVTKINGYAFQDATLPSAIKIPSSVTTMNYTNAFYGCSNLRHLLVATGANRTGVNTYTFYGTPSSMVVHVPGSNDGPQDRDDAAFYTDAVWKDHNVTYGAWDAVVDGYPYILRPYTVDDNNQYKAACLVYGTNVGNASNDYTLLKSGAITIPETFSFKGVNYKVISITAGAFKNNSQITSVTLKQPMNPFHGGGQFENCTALKYVYFGNRASLETAIPARCFRNTRVPKFDLPYGVSSVGEYAFADNPSLTEIRIPSSVTYGLAGNFVRGCSSLQKMYINTSPPGAVAEGAFVEPDNSSTGWFYNVPKSCKIYVPVGKRTSYIDHCSWAQSGEIYHWRYFSSSNIQPGAYDFDGLTHVSSMNYDIPDDAIAAEFVYSPECAWFYENPYISEQTYRTDSYGRRWYYVALSDSCFAGSTSLHNVYIDWNDRVLKEIPKFAFRDTPNLTSFQWPDKPCKLSSIGEHAFRNTGLQGVVDVTKTTESFTMKTNAFYKSQNVTGFKLPATSYKLEGGSMYQDLYGSKLTTVTCLATTPPTNVTNTTWNSQMQPSQTLYVPSASVNAYKAAEYWKKFGHILPLVVNGDVNNDGHVTSVDVTALYNYLLNGDASNLVNGDVDGDGHISSVDVTAIYNMLLGQ